MLKRSSKLKKAQVSEEDDYDEIDSKGTTELYGKWQLEPLRLPRAVDGIVPKVIVVTILWIPCWNFLFE